MPLKLITKKALIVDHVATGMAVNQFRHSHRVGLRDMAARCRLSPGYLCDLEHGRKHWTRDLIDRVKSALEL